MINGLTLPSVSTLPELRMAPSLGTPGPELALPANNFGAVLKDFAASTVGAVRQGEAAAIAGVQGSLPLQTVVESVMTAERTLQIGIAVRDKLVSSYLEITRMQI